MGCLHTLKGLASLYPMHPMAAILFGKGHLAPEPHGFICRWACHSTAAQSQQEGQLPACVVGVWMIVPHCETRTCRASGAHCGVCQRFLGHKNCR